MRVEGSGFGGWWGEGLGWKVLGQVEFLGCWGLRAHRVVGLGLEGVLLKEVLVWEMTAQEMGYGVHAISPKDPISPVNPIRSPINLQKPLQPL